jgi:hypothetical protein
MDAKYVALLKEHLPYEHRMLDEAHKVITSPSPALDWFAKNAAINVFWLHARNLIEFYRSPKSADASASHFTNVNLLPEFKLKKGQPADAKHGQELVTLINEQICHLKYERVTSPNEKLSGYDYTLAKEAIDRARDKFQSSLTDEARRVWEVQCSPVELAYVTSEASATNEIVIISSSPSSDVEIDIADNTITYRSTSGSQRDDT